MSNEKLSQDTGDDKKVINPLQPVWNGIHQEYCSYRGNLVGILLTFVESIITDPKQLKSVQSMIRKFIWEDTEVESNMAMWFQWLDANYHLQGQDCDSKMPRIYDASPTGDFMKYTRR